MNRLEAAWKALTAREVIVVSRGFQFTTYDNVSCIQSGDYLRVEVGSPKDVPR